MRVMTGIFLATVPAAIVVAFLAEYRGSSVASPLTVTLVAAAASLWIGFAANRDAGNRLEKIRRAFAVHGDESRLLRDHWLVYLAVLVRLEMMVVCGLIVSLWGLGPGIGVWLLVLGALMMVLTWPTARKTQLLLGRARALRDDD
jgi:undecaprenyl pyrophosphate phosphatase UppP